MTGPSDAVVLETHVWIWLINGRPDLSPRSRTVIEQAANQGSVSVPAISVWEVAMLEAKGRIALARPCGQWVTEALSAPGLIYAPLTPEISVESCRLPGTFHGDPADRMIVATARILGATLATRDNRILEYGARGHIGAVPA